MQPGRPGSAPSSLSSPRPQIPSVSGAPAAALSPLQKVPQSSPASVHQQAQRLPVSMATSPPQPTLQSNPSSSAQQSMPSAVDLAPGLQQSPLQSAPLSLPQPTALPGGLSSLSQLQPPTGADVSSLSSPVPSPVKPAASAAPPAAANVLSLDCASQPASAPVLAPASSAAASISAVSQGVLPADSQHSLAGLHNTAAAVDGGIVSSTQDAQQHQDGGSLPASAAGPVAGSLTAPSEPEACQQPVSAALIAARSPSSTVSAAVLGHSLQPSQPQPGLADQKTRPSTAPAGSSAALSSSEQGQASAMDIDGQGTEGTEQIAPPEVAQPQTEPPQEPQAQESGPGLPASAAPAQSAAMLQSLPGIQPPALAAIAGSSSADGARPEQLPSSAPAAQRPGSLTKPALPMASSVAQHWLGGSPASLAARPPPQQGDELTTRCACSQTCCFCCRPALASQPMTEVRWQQSRHCAGPLHGMPVREMTRMLTTWPCSAGARQQQGLSALISGAVPAASVTQGSSASVPMQLPQVVLLPHVPACGRVMCILSIYRILIALCSNLQLLILLLRCKGFPGASTWRPGPFRRRCS